MIGRCMREKEKSGGRKGRKIEKQKVY